MVALPWLLPGSASLSVPSCCIAITILITVNTAHPQLSLSLPLSWTSLVAAVIYGLLANAQISQPCTSRDRGSGREVKSGRPRIQWSHTAEVQLCVVLMQSAGCLASIALCYLSLYPFPGHSSPATQTQPDPLHPAHRHFTFPGLLPASVHLPRTPSSIPLLLCAAHLVLLIAQLREFSNLIVDIRSSPYLTTDRSLAALLEQDMRSLVMLRDEARHRSYGFTSSSGVRSHASEKFDAAANTTPRYRELSSPLDTLYSSRRRPKTAILHRASSASTLFDYGAESLRSPGSVSTPSTPPELATYHNMTRSVRENAAARRSLGLDSPFSTTPPSRKNKQRRAVRFDLSSSTTAAGSSGMDQDRQKITPDARIGLTSRALDWDAPGDYFSLPLSSDRSGRDDDLLRLDIPGEAIEYSLDSPVSLHHTHLDDKPTTDQNNLAAESWQLSPLVTTPEALV